MLITFSQIEANLRRTAEKGYISLLDHYGLEKLAIKYFGIYEEDELIGYQCPYSGELITDYRNLVLEHIIPVSSKGGTVLFNCIPTSEEVNKVSEKGAKHLIDWWTNSKYWNETAPQRLEKLVNYILEGYNNVFLEYTIEEVKNSYLEIDLDYEIEEEADLNYTSRNESKLLEKQSQENKIHSYLGFILDCINTLDTYNIDTTNIKNNLKQLEEKEIFKDIERYQTFQNIIQSLIKSKLSDDIQSHLTYLLRFNTKKLMNSISSNNINEIITEINARLNNLENLLSENNLSIVDYFKSLGNIEDIDIIYKNINNITNQEKDIFLENIKIGIDTKINIYINMLNKGNSNILKVGNEETLEGYPHVKLTYFWQDHKEKIKKRLFEELKDNPEYDSARKLIDINEITNDIDKKVEIFINMLNKGNSNILIDGNEEILEGYPSIKLSYFWGNNKGKIKKKLFEELKENPEYDTARRMVDINEITIDVEKQIPIFIKMLNKGNSNILKMGNEETLEGYPSIKLSYFWSSHKERIKKKLFEELKDNSEYDTARRLIDINEITNDIDKKVEIFINMLNKGSSNILIYRNEETLEGYPSIKLSHFWGSNKERIKKKLFEELKDNSEYDTARRLIDINEMTINVEKQIPIFINMLNKGNSNILIYGNEETLEGYPNIKLSHFWNRHKERIKKKLFEELKDNPEYDTARRLIDINKITNDIDKKVEIFIKMLNKGNSNILIYGNEETLEGYPHVKLTYFWNDHKEKIKKRLFEELKDNPEYDTARRLIDINEITNDIDKKVEIFINMLNKGSSNILKRGNQETLEGYSNIKLSQFWSRHKERIKKKLFEELKDNPEYDTARRLIDVNEMTINVENQIPIFINMLNKGNSNILKHGNEETLEGYPSIKLSYFWGNNKDKIKKKLFEELKDNPEYDTARRMVDINEITIDVENQIPIFIKMLNKGNSNILKVGNEETLEGYPSIKLSYFWSSHKERIKKKLFEELKDNSEYDTARRIVDINEITINIELQIPIFINMLNKGNSNILKTGNKETLEGYPSIKLSRFWNRHKERIKKKLFEELKDNPEYDTARRMVDINEMTIDVEKQIPIFINMLNKGNSNILKTGNKETLEGYPAINLANFWQNKKDIVTKKLFEELKDNPEYDTARRLIDNFNVTNDIDKKVDIFIEMLNKGNTNILKRNNQETLEGYPHIKLTYFWNDHKEKIKKKLFEELKDNPEYDTARRMVDITEIAINVEKQIPIFINMLNKGNSNILKKGNEETLEGYPSIKLSYFWSNNKDKIKNKLFEELKDNREYDKARQTVLTYFNVNSYEELEEKERKKQQLKELKKLKQTLEITDNSLIEENITNRKRA